MVFFPRDYILPRGAIDLDDDDNDTQSRKAMKRQLSLIERLGFQVVAAVVICIAIYAASLETAQLRAFSLLCASLLAGLVVGGLLGFIFGIPRFLRQADAPPPPAPAPATASAPGTAPQPATPTEKAYRSFAGNTNLEEISDWLTKIIVGLGLVEGRKILEAGRTIAVEFSRQMGDAAGAGAIFVAVVLAASLGGFLFFYIETRTRVTLLLTDADSAAGGSDAIRKKETEQALSAPIGSSKVKEGGLDSGPQPQPDDVDRKFLAIPFENLRAPEEFAAWGAAQARSGNTQAAVRALQEAISRNPDDKRYLSMLADTQLRQRNPQAAISAFSEARAKSPDDDVDLLRRELLTSLYLPQPDSFTHALAIGAILLDKKPEAARDSMVQLWLAAAAGQKFDWLRRNNGQPAELQAARAAALQRVRNVVEYEPTPTSPARLVLRKIFDPDDGGRTGENDLVVFFDDTEFRAVILGEIPPQEQPLAPKPTEEPQPLE